MKISAISLYNLSIDKLKESAIMDIKFYDDHYVTNPVEERINKSTLKELGAIEISKTGRSDSEFRFTLYLVQSKNDDTYWIASDWDTDKFAYRVYKSPF